MDATSIATGVSPASSKARKQQLYREQLRSDVGQSIEDSKLQISVHMKKDDYKEGVAALLEKRPPRFVDPVQLGFFVDPVQLACSVSTKRAPVMTLGSMVSVPPFRSAMSRAMARPRPLPPVAVDR